jgi:molybdate transport system permease protein
LLGAVGGVPLAYLLARHRTRWSALLGCVVQLPLALPPLASGVLLLFVLGYDSPLGRLTGGALTDSFIGIVLAESFVATPFLIVAARSAFADADPALEDVAATLGHGPGAVFRKVSLPVARRAILAGMLLAWLRAFGEFGATIMVAYHPYSLPILTYVAFGGAGLPAMPPVLVPTLVIALGAMIAGLAIATPRTRPPVAEAPGPIVEAPAIAHAAEGPELVLDLDHTRGDFSLRVAFRTRARVSRSSVRRGPASR